MQPMSLFKKTLKRILPRCYWDFIRSASQWNRISITPKVEEFADPHATTNAVGAVDSYWHKRIQMVISCPDNHAIPRSEQAGLLENGVVTMHNGLKVGGLSYYGAGIMNLLIANKGVHEPQEERAFQDILSWVTPGSTMLELGAYWGFYSLWFSQSVVDAKNFLVEPIKDNLEAGRLNFSLNGKQAVFENAFVGATSERGHNCPPTISVDSFLAKHKIEHLAVLHSDVQGAELAMLHGAVKSLNSHAIDFCFISTHSTNLHVDCLNFLRQRKYRTLVDANLDQSYAEDGLIVACSPAAKGPSSLMVSVRT